MSENEPKEKRKRQRLSLVCLHWKPTCSNCQRFGVECNYELPHWVNSSLEKKTVTTSITSNDEYKHKSREELLHEIEQLKNKLNKSSPNTPNGSTEIKSTHSNFTQVDYFTSSVDLGLNNNDIIDLYESYNTLAMKHSSHEEHKPLSPMAISKMDHYLAFFMCYMFVSIKLTPSSVSDMFKETWKSKHSDGSSKWLYLLDLKNRDSELKNAIDRIIGDRATLCRINVFPFLNMRDSNQDEVEALTRSIEQTLPSKSFAENYLDFFFHFIWISKPFIDEVSFKKEVTRIISFDDETKRPKITFSQRSDFATIATLLIILRYSSIAIAVIDDDELPSFLTSLKENPVSVKAITVARMCLSMYKVLKKTTIHVIQSLLYLRSYFKDCPEDGDGLTLSQSQLLFGFIVQSAVTMGLHRDPQNYSQVSNDMNEVNLRRRIWYCIEEMDNESAILSGSLSALPHRSLIDVKIPTITSIDTVEHAQVKEIELRRPLLEIYEQLSFSINNMQQKPTLHKIISLLDQSRSYVDTHYSLNSMESLKHLNCGTRIFRATMFTNLKHIQKQLIQLSLEITTYYSLCLHYESNSHLEANLYRLFLKKTLLSCSAALDLSASYLSGSFNEYCTPIHTNYGLCPLIITSCFRVMNTLMSILLKVYHAQDLLESNYIFSVDSNIKQKALDDFSNDLSKKFESALFLMRKKLSKKYYQSLKILGCFHYAYILLKNDKFKMMNRIIKFLESDEKSSIGDDVVLNGPRRDEIKKHFQKNKSLITSSSEWMQLNNTVNWIMNSNNSNSSEDPTFEGENETIMNINNTNLLADFTESEIKFYTDLLKTEPLKSFSIPNNVDPKTSTELFNSSSSSNSTPNDSNNDIYQRVFNEQNINEITPQISNMFKATRNGGTPQNNENNDGFLGDIFDRLMGTNATVDDVFTF
ncbi:Oleate-activated transcription factor 1 [Wickerhamomyces ciferrii]|uniref:Oleate-activated transcription factor 1 n=1 Tax=Wickerhamomyces ciferrii (strain ATCC 14091 / BCRC 22168 / CBS 111 / JCM 3599 / NBRC 0793 / NRRL Y-1031 F-60-10) TaxID=1206466 RepID=K0KVI9_WICCF|nr:Oleate-activated transcription factor 1 [Wickerhamomyces ciferrii]CCH45479.1 Oleate-activated transcription factor 1 [Wickerhamomyces ciferrii]